MNYWYIGFRSGQGVLRDVLHIGRLPTSVNAGIVIKRKELVNAKWWITISEVSNEVDIVYWSVQAILTTVDGMGVCKICSTIADR